MRERWWMLSVLGALLGTATACDDNLFGVQQAVDGEGACASSPEGYAGVQDVVTDHCVECHDADAKLGDLDLETDLIAATVGVVGKSGSFLVSEGAPDESVLYQRMLGEGGGPMPPTGALDSSCTDVVKAWIEGGALAQ